jgi:hypothetical protein
VEKKKSQSLRIKRRCAAVPVFFLEPLQQQQKERREGRREGRGKKRRDEVGRMAGWLEEE